MNMLSAREIIQRYSVCRTCSIVDTDVKRIFVDNKCRICGAASEGGRMYFDMPVRIVGSLLDEAYQLLNHDSNDKKTLRLHSVSTVLYFNTLKETMMNRLIDRAFIANDIPNSFAQKMLADNKLYSQKQNSLLPAMLDKTWREIIAEVSETFREDFTKLDDLLKRVAKARNTFLHEGDHFDISEQLAKESYCGSKILANFYVSVHNHYIHPAVMKKIGQGKKVESLS